MSQQIKCNMVPVGIFPPFNHPSLITIKRHQRIPQNMPNRISFASKRIMQVCMNREGGQNGGKYLHANDIKIQRII